MDKSMTLKPRVTEKTYAMSQMNNTYVFDVPKTTNKLEVEKAVAAQFDVKVKEVRMLIVKGKKARSIRIGAKARANVMGMRSDVKKAYVTLFEGEYIPVFAALDEQAEKEKQAQEKSDKKTSDEKPKKKLSLRKGAK